MLGYRLTGRIEMLRNGIGRHRLQGDKCNDGPPRWIGNSLKNVSSHFVDGLFYEAVRLQIYEQPFGFANLFYFATGSVSPPDVAEGPQGLNNLIFRSLE